MCETLRELLKEAIEAGNAPLVSALRAAIEAAGCAEPADPEPA